MSHITLYFLQASRAIRIAWLLEELGLGDYKLEFSGREANRLPPPEFTAKIPAPLGKSPTIKDGDLVVFESGAITEYLCETYDSNHQLLPSDKVARSKVREWVHASEGAFMIHGLAIVYPRWRMPDAEGANAPVLAALEEALSKNVQRDLDWLESELGKGQGKFLVGDTVTAADCNVHYSVDLILKMQLGTQGRKWEKIEQWLKNCEATATFQAALKKTGYSLGGVRK